MTEIAGGAAKPERVVGLHFFNPAPVLPLVEVVRTELVDEAVYESAYAFAAALGKEPIRCHDTPGFVVNRILIPLLNDCVRVLDESRVTPEDLDQAMRFGLNWPIGPCALIDLIGIDVHVHASEALWQSLREPRMAPPPRLVAMAKAGLLGRKSGRGFYCTRSRTGRSVPPGRWIALRRSVAPIANNRVPRPDQAHAHRTCDEQRTSL